MNKADRVTDYLVTIAEEIGSRRAGTKACERTAEWIRTLFFECGYETDFFEIPFVAWEADEAQIQYDDKVIKGYANLYSPAGTGEGEAIVIHNLYELRKKDIRGKVCIFTDELTESVLYLGDTPFQSSRDVDVQEALDYQVPAAVIVINPKENSILPYIEKYIGAPSLTVTKQYEEEVLALEHKTVKVSISSFSEDSVTGNIIGRTKQAKEKIVISAHYDTAEGSPGAWDNGSGVVAMLELAKRFENKDLNVEIEFAAMCPHEIGYPGSVTYTNTEQAELDKVLFNINIDGIGAAEGIDTITSENLPNWLFRIMKNVLQNYEEIEDYGAIQVEGDHFAYTWNDIPSVLLTSESSMGLHHENIDGMSNVDINKILRVVDFIEEFICEISAAI